jgi:hypothetical protein
MVYLFLNQGVNDIRKRLDFKVRDSDNETLPGIYLPERTGITLIPTPSHDETQGRCPSMKLK